MPRRRVAKRGLDSTILEAALAGLELRRQRLDAQIAEVRRRIGGRGPRGAAARVPSRPVRKRRLSAAARKSIAAAQRKRWAEWRKRQKARA